MTAGELIEQLQKLPQDYEVKVISGQDFYTPVFNFQVTRCGEGCPTTCDFCIYTDRGTDLYGKWTCSKTGEEVDASCYCEYYHCFKVPLENTGG